MFFHKNSSENITDIQAKLKYVQKTYKKLENLHFFVIFLLKTNLTFFKKNDKNFGKKSGKMLVFGGAKFLINPASG